MLTKAPPVASWKAEAQTNSGSSEPLSRRSATPSSGTTKPGRLVRVFDTALMSAVSSPPTSSRLEEKPEWWMPYSASQPAKHTCVRPSVQE